MKEYTDVQRGYEYSSLGYLEEAAKWYRKAADAGEPYAMRELGLMYLNGNGVPQDDAQALQLLGRAGELDAYRQMYEDFRGVAAELKEHGIADPIIQEALNADAKACLNLGQFYANKVRAEQGAVQGFRARFWLEKAARAGKSEAMMELGYLHEECMTDETDDTGTPTAGRYFIEAGDLGNVDGMIRGVHCFLEIGDDDLAAEYLLKAATCYLEGRGVKRSPSRAIALCCECYGCCDDHDLAIEWLTAAARLDPQMPGLQDLYTNIVSNSEKADHMVECHRFFAEAGNAAAMFKMAVAYRRGYGIETDPVESARWLGKAVARDATPAVALFNEYYQSGNIDQSGNSDDSMAIEWLSAAAKFDPKTPGLHDLYTDIVSNSDEADHLVESHRVFADAGNSAAMFKMAIAYRDGNGIEKDLVESARWLVRAAEAGNESAKVAVAEL